MLDEAGAWVRVYGRRRKAARARGRSDTKVIEQVVARIARIPAASVSSGERERLKDLDARLKAQIFGQDHAVDLVVRAIRKSRAGFGERDKPVASLLFVGPTGVGKTELARQLAEILGVSLLRFDMSEYQEKHTVSRLIGAPPGYVGYDDGGLLTDAIRKNPHAVLLLDEIEKAHQDIYNMLLQIMDYATLTDNNGKKADFRNVVLIMTSNAGAREIGKPLVGFGERLGPGRRRVRRRGANLRSRVQEPPGRRGEVQRPGARDRSADRGQGRPRVPGGACREERDPGGDPGAAWTGWPARDTRRSSARGRSPGWCLPRSRTSSWTRSSSAAWPPAGKPARTSTGTGWQSRSSGDPSLRLPRRRKADGKLCGRGQAAQVLLPRYFHGAHGLEVRRHELHVEQRKARAGKALHH